MNKKPFKQVTAYTDDTHVAASNSSRMLEQSNKNAEEINAKAYKYARDNWSEEFCKISAHSYFAGYANAQPRITQLEKQNSIYKKQIGEYEFRLIEESRVKNNAKRKVEGVEKQNRELSALLYCWSQLDSPEDFYSCSPTLKKESDKILNPVEFDTFKIK